MESVKLDKFTISWLEGDIFKIVVHDGAYGDLEDMREIQFHKARMTHNRRHGVLLISPLLGSLSKEARAYMATEESSINTLCRALVARNLGMRILINLFMRINKPGIPHKAFTNEAEATLWLVEQLTKNLPEAD